MSNLKISSIYAIRCKTTGKVYIGRSQDPLARTKQHFQKLKNGSCECGTASFQEDFNKYGASDFEMYILESGVVPGKFREREAYWIGEYQATDHRYGYNKDTMEHGQTFTAANGLPPNLAKLSKSN